MPKQRVVRPDRSQRALAIVEKVTGGKLVEDKDKQQGDAVQRLIMPVVAYVLVHPKKTAIGVNVPPGVSIEDREIAFNAGLVILEGLHREALELSR